MIDNDKYVFCNMSLKIVTPSCVADGEKLTARDYFYDPSSGVLYFVNTLKWHQFILKHNLFDSYSKYMATDTKVDRRNLLDWLKSCGYGLKDIMEFVIHKTRAEVNVVNPSDKKTANDVFGHIRLADGRVYFPGSSIKGFIRSAIIYHILCEKSDIRDLYWKDILRKCNNGRPDRRFLKDLQKIAGNLEQDLINTLYLIKKNGELIKKSNTVTSTLKGLQISDAMPAGETDTALLQKIDLVLGREKKENSISVFRECVLQGSEFCFTIKIDKNLLKATGIDSPEKLIDCANTFTKFINSILQKAFKKDYPDIFSAYSSANIYLGGNTGFISKTIVAALAPTTADAAEVIRVIMENQFVKAKHMLNDKIISPRTLKSTKYNGELIPMGLAEISLRYE